MFHVVFLKIRIWCWILQYSEVDICFRFVSDWVRLLTSIPKYKKSSIGFISFGCFNWSESLSWHRTLSFLTWLMLIDRHFCSMIHRFLQWLFMCGPINNVILAKTWPTKAKPRLGSENLTRLQISENFKTGPFDKLYNLDITQLQLVKRRWKLEENLSQASCWKHQEDTNISKLLF